MDAQWVPGVDLPDSKSARCRDPTDAHRPIINHSVGAEVSTDNPLRTVLSGCGSRLKGGDPNDETDREGAGSGEKNLAH